MINYLLCALGMWMLLSLMVMWRDETSHHWVDTLCEVIIYLPWHIIGVALVVVLFPIVCIWKFFRNAIKGVSVECWKKANIKSYWKLGNLRFCYDSKARAWCNKFFLVRIVKPAETINHNPVLKSGEKS